MAHPIRHFGSNGSSGLNHCPKSRSKSTPKSVLPKAGSSKVSTTPSGKEVMKSVLPKSAAIGSEGGGIDWPGGFMPAGVLTRMAEGEGAVMALLGVGGAVPPCPKLPPFEVPGPGFGF